MENLSEEEFRKIVRKTIKERYEDDDDLGIYGGGFDEFEFDNDAMRAAKADIEASGEEFEELGKSKFEKDPKFKEKFKSSVKQANLNLPSDDEEIARLANVIKQKKAHEKQFGAGSLNEDFEEGPQPGDVEYHNDYEKMPTGLSKFSDIDWVAIYETLTRGEDLGRNDMIEAGLTNEDLDLLYHHNVISAYGDVTLWDENTSLENFIEQVKNAYRQGFNEQALNEMQIDRPTDSEGNPITLKVRVEHKDKGTAGRVERFIVGDDGEMRVKVNWIQDPLGDTLPSIVSTQDIVVRDKSRVIKEEESTRYMFFSNLEQMKSQAEKLLGLDENKLSEILESGHDWAQDHIATAKESMDQAFDFIMNEIKNEDKTSEETTEVIADINEGELNEMYNFSDNSFLDALIGDADLDYMKSENPDVLEFDLMEAIYVFRHDYNEDHPFIHYLGSLLQKDNFKGSPALNSYEDLENEGKMIYDALVRGEEFYKEKYLDGAYDEVVSESNIRSHANGRGQNKKPANYPKQFKRGALRENSEKTSLTNEEFDYNREEIEAHDKKAFEEEMDKEIFYVVDNDFNRAHYPDLVGKTFENPPGYAQVKVVKQGDIEFGDNKNTNMEEAKKSREKDLIFYESRLKEDSSDSLANKHGENAKPETIEESYGDRYEQIVFLQGNEADHALNILMQDGRDEAMDYLKQWHYPGEHDGSNELGHGSMDKTYEKDGYIMSWNSSIGYIGLVYDTEYNKELDEDSQMKRHLAGQREKTVPLGQHAPHSQKAKK